MAQNLIDWLSQNTSSIIALCAFFIATYQAFLIRYHNKILLRPYLRESFNRNIFDDNQTSSIELNVENFGPGLAIIKDCELFYDEKLVDVNTESKSLSFIYQVLEELPQSYSFTIPQVNSVIPKDAKITIFKVCFNRPNLNTLEKISDLDDVFKTFDKFSMRIKYDSLDKQGEFFLYFNQT